MRAVIYARYSSDKQNEASIEGQLRECKEYAEYNHIDIVGTYIDRALSAKTDNRPDFQRMISDSKTHQFDTVIVWKFDRFARNRYDSAVYQKILSDNGVRLLSVKEEVADGPEGIIVKAMFEAYAEYYSAELSVKVKRGMKENAINGRWNGGQEPFGYYAKDHKLYIDESVVEIIRLAFKMCADGKPIKEIHKYFVEKNILNKKGKPMSYQSVRYMLSNRIYIGEYSTAGYTHENWCEPIIDKTTFEKVQATVHKFSIAPATFRKDDDYILTTKLFCGKCGAIMTAYSGTSYNGKVYKYYACNRQRKHECDKKKVDKNAIEELVVSKILEIISQDKTIDYLAEQLEKFQFEENTVIPILEKQLKENQKEIDNIVSAIAKGVSSDALLEKLSSLETRKKNIEESLAEENIKAPLLTKEQFKQALLEFRKIDTDTREGKRKLVDTFVNSIYLYDDSIKIIYNGNQEKEVIPFAEVESSKTKQKSQPNKKSN
ncbi:MAG: recombinase family protein [Clostridia bacterium]|nr:recombinase family protein [Clostridia bacterium]